MQHDPGYILQTATGFWASKVPLTAVEFNLLSLAMLLIIQELISANGVARWDFSVSRLLVLAGPASAAIAYK